MSWKIVLFVLGGLIASLASAGDPAPNVAADSIEPHRQALRETARLSPDAALAKGRELRALSDQGDAHATYQLYLLISTFGPFAPLADADHAKGWSEIAGYDNALDWLMKAASQGSKDSMPLVCKLAEDYLAPADRQVTARKWCAELKLKYPDGQDAAVQ